MAWCMQDKESSWLKIVEQIKTCTLCPLHKYRRNPVPGEGSLNAEIFFLGEAPGRREDEMGRPFVGAAGQLLNKLLEDINIKRSEVFITNVVKCRPPNNRDPKDDEIRACSVYTDSLISLIRPKVIVTLGNHAGRYIFEFLGNRRWLGISKIRGKVYEVNLRLDLRVKVIPTYHPAAALYNPQLREALESDFKLIVKALSEVRGEGRRPTLLNFIKH